MSGKSHAPILRAGPRAIADAAGLLRRGGLVALPTETVYGLAARADDDEAVARIYRAKGRPSFNPLIVHVPGLAQAELLASFDRRARALAERFWPGPLTLVLPRAPEACLALAVTAGLPTIALRCPAHPIMREVLEQAGVPLAAPSANRSGGVSPTSADHVAASLGDRIDAILDGGICDRGVESTIVALRPQGWDLLRPGPVLPLQVAEVAGPPLGPADRAGGIEAPGQLASHYAPGKPVRLGAVTADADEFHIGFGPVRGDISLSRSEDLTEAASRLYAALHLGAASPKPRIAVAPIPEQGIGAAINDRLRRAAADQ